MRHLTTVCACALSLGAALLVLTACGSGGGGGGAGGGGSAPAALHVSGLWSIAITGAASNPEILLIADPSLGGTHIASIITRSPHGVTPTAAGFVYSFNTTTATVTFTVTGMTNDAWTGLFSTTAAPGSTPFTASPLARGVALGSTFLGRYNLPSDASSTLTFTSLTIAKVGANITFTLNDGSTGTATVDSENVASATLTGGLHLVILPTTEGGTPTLHGFIIKDAGTATQAIQGFFTFTAPTAPV